MEQEQTPKDEGYKAGGSMPNQPERDPKTGAVEGEEEQTPTPVEEPVAETEPAEETGDENPVGGDDVEPEESQDDGDAEAEDKEKERDAEEANSEAELEGGERNE